MKAYQQTATEVLERVAGNMESGLLPTEVVERRKKIGKNAFDEPPKKHWLAQLAHHLTDFTTLILIVAALISFYMAFTTDHGDYIEGLMIVAIVLLNAVLAFFQERNAEKALESLKRLNQQQATVWRAGKQVDLAAEELVVGDLLIVEAGSMIAADARLLEGTDLRVEEAALTGESEPVEKTSAALPVAELALGDQTNMLFSGCTVVNGRGRAVVVATGMQTEMGKIAALLNQETTKKTPLQQRLNQLGKRISLLALLAAAVVFGIGLIQGEPLLEMFMTAISLAVAAVPETLMVIVTLTLSVGVQKMVKKNAIIRQLPAVETLGTADVICSDKTGTLTENKMRVRKIWTHGETEIDLEAHLTEEGLEVLRLATLCSNAQLSENEETGELEVVGNPTEGALVRALAEYGEDRERLEKAYPRLREVPFDSSRKLMTTVHRRGKKYMIITKGAFDYLLPHLGYGDVEQAQRINARFGQKALRVLAIAYRLVEEDPRDLPAAELEKGLTLAGLTGMIDPPRPESKAAIRRAKRAGIKTVMITGDHVVTATAIAKELGIVKTPKEALSGEELRRMSQAELVENVQRYSVYARVSPEDKIRIVKAWQASGSVVAMTGDGVNDAPALKASDVGCAMGIAGTDVAKGAADIVLTDDNFATIVDAVAQGRTVYENIRKTVHFLLSCNISEIFIVLLAMLFGWGSPVIALQLLFVNVVADGLPGFALSREPAEKGIMERSPIKKTESLFGGGLWKWIAFNSGIFTVLTLWGYYLGSFVGSVSDTVAPSHAVGQTMAFLILGYSSILHIFNCRSSESIFKVQWSRNKRLVEMALLALVIMTAVALVPVLQTAFELVPISLHHWAIVVGFSLLPVGLNELVKFHFAKEE